MNDKLIRRRKFLPNTVSSLRFEGEHNSSNNYNMTYQRKNINDIRHLLSEQINSLGLWECDLRNYNGNKQQITQKVKTDRKVNINK